MMTNYQSLVWGIKSSWVEYVSRMRDGRIETTGGAVQLESGEFSFPFAGESEVGLRFEGGVHFTGHFGMLSVSFVDPSIEHGDDGTYLTIADEGGETPRLKVVRFDSISTTRDEPNLDSPRLTEDGADLFFDHYRPVTKFASVRLTRSGHATTLLQRQAAS